MNPHQKALPSKLQARIVRFVGCSLALISLVAAASNTAQTEVQDAAPAKAKSTSYAGTIPPSSGLDAKTRRFQGALATALQIQTLSDFQIFYGQAKEATETRNGKFYKKQKFDESGRLTELTTSYGEPKTNFLYKGAPIDTYQEIVDGKLISDTRYTWKNGELEKSKTTFTGSDGSREREYLYSFYDNKSVEILTIKNPDGSLFTERTFQPGTDRILSLKRNLSLYTPGNGISGSRIENVEYAYIDISKEDIKDALIQRPGPGIGESMRITIINTSKLPAQITMHDDRGSCVAEYYSYKYDKNGNWIFRSNERYTGVLNQGKCKQQTFSNRTETNRTISYYRQK